MAENTVESIVAEAVKAKVQTMMVEALGDPGDLVKAIVAETLSMKVKGDGYREVSLIQKIAKEAIVDEARNVMREFIDEQREAIRAELKRHLTTHKSDIAEALIESVVQASNNQYGLRLVFQKGGED